MRGQVFHDSNRRGCSVGGDRNLWRSMIMSGDEGMMVRMENRGGAVEVIV